MKTRLIQTLLATAALALVVSPGAIAADLTDVGYLDQAAVASLPPFQSANAQLAQYQAQTKQEFDARMRAARTDAARQQISMEFQQRMDDRQRELLGPLITRTQLAIAQVAGTKNLSIVVDRRIIVYGGADITKDVIGALAGGAAIAPPSASPPPSEVGFVDQTALQSNPKLKSASDEMATFAADQKKIYSQKMAQATTNDDKQKVAAEFNKTLTDKQNALLNPIIDQTKSATANVAKQKQLLLVIDRADVVYGGTDITKDVQDALSK